MSFESDKWEEMVKRSGQGGSFGEEEAEEGSIAVREETQNVPGQEITRNERVYAGMEKIVQDNPELKKYFLDIQKSVKRYVSTIDALHVLRMKKMVDKKAVGFSDSARKIAHDALIDNLNIFSRACIKAKIDNSWRREVGLDRKEITVWAVAVYDTVVGELSKEE